MTQNVRLAGSGRVHAIYAGGSGIIAKALLPACGVSLGSSNRRVPTDEAVTCPKCSAA